MKWLKNRRQELLSWLFVAALSAVSVCLAILQYHWIGDVSRAEGERLRASLRENLARFSRDFNTELSVACSALLPARLDDKPAEREKEYASRFASHNRIVRAMWLVEPAGDEAILKKLNADGTFEVVDWPLAWRALEERMSARLGGERPPPGGRGLGLMGGGPDDPPDLVEIPRFPRPGADRWPESERPSRERRPDPERRSDPDRPRPFRAIEWVLFQLDIDFLRGSMIPELLQRDLGSDYQAQVVAAAKPSEIIYSRDTSAGPIDGSADGEVHFFELRPDLMISRFSPASGRWRNSNINMQALAGPDRGRWTLLVRHRAGSLEAVVSKARTKNLAVTTGLFVLLLAAMAALVQFTRRSQKLAELQMEFVAGVSHELRTPLSVMRTAGHNLRGKMASDPMRVQRYGELIEEESEKLTAIVEQVLRFANVRAGRVIGLSEPVSVASLIDAAVQADRKLIDQSGCVLERNIAPELPPVKGDPTSLKHALRNLLSNAAKYGRSGDWIGVSAAPGPAGNVEIRIADHGPGIPADEVNRIFDPFYRGKSAVQDQIHGTGLGLSLAKRIIEAHDGTIAVRTEAGKGTEFIVHIPVAVQEKVA